MRDMALTSVVTVLALVVSAQGSVGPSTNNSLCSESKECLQYELLCKTDEYEVRRYSSTRWVSTDAEAYFMGVGAAMAFRRLFQYITGDNQGGYQMEMTAPVLVKIPEETRMWEPAIYTLSFPLPSAYQDTPPQPNNDKLYFTDMPQMDVYVRSYGGWMLSVTARLHAHLLTKELDRVKAAYNCTWHYGVGYDSPLKLLNRHNEVWYVAEGEPVCSDPQEPTPPHPVKRWNDHPTDVHPSDPSSNHPNDASSNPAIDPSLNPARLQSDQPPESLPDNPVDSPLDTTFSDPAVDPSSPQPDPSSDHLLDTSSNPARLQKNEPPEGFHDDHADPSLDTPLDPSSNPSSPESDQPPESLPVDTTLDPSSPQPEVLNTSISNSSQPSPTSESTPQATPSTSSQEPPSSSQAGLSSIQPTNGAPSQAPTSAHSPPELTPSPNSTQSEDPSSDKP